MGLADLIIYGEFATAGQIIILPLSFETAEKQPFVRRLDLCSDSREQKSEAVRIGRAYLGSNVAGDNMASWTELDAVLGEVEADRLGSRTRGTGSNRDEKENNREEQSIERKRIPRFCPGGNRVARVRKYFNSP